MDNNTQDNGNLKQKIEELKGKLAEADRDLLQFLVKAFPSAESVLQRNGIPKKIYLSTNLYKALAEQLLMIRRFQVIEVKMLEPDKMILIWPGEEAKEAELEHAYNLR